MERYRPQGLIGVVHLSAMPGDPKNDGLGFAEVLQRAEVDARALAEGGANAIIVENFGSSPFPKGTPDERTAPHQIALLTLAVHRCQAFGIPVGVNVLRNDVFSALGIAAATGAHFVRVNVHVGAYVTDQGLIEGRAWESLRYRAAIGAAAVAILADVRVKHAMPLAPLPLNSEVRDCLQRGGADAVIVTGSGTGYGADLGQLQSVSEAAEGFPVLIGSGLTPATAAVLAPYADAAIVGTWLKHDGELAAPVDVKRVGEMRRALDASLRS